MELLEYIAGKMGCSYLSDLISSPQSRFFIVKALQKTKPDDFPLADWQDAANYLYGSAPRFATAREAGDFMLRRESGPRRRQ